jgi:hypothetical protein
LNWSQAGGTNWSDAAARQRVYEWAVDPALLQNLPEHALLLADRSGASLQLRAIEYDPAIINLPGASAMPFPPPGSLHDGSAPPPIPTNYDQAGSAIAPADQYPADWQESGDLDYEPAWPGEEPELPWWHRNQPPDQRP